MGKREATLHANDHFCIGIGLIVDRESAFSRLLSRLVAAVPAPASAIPGITRPRDQTTLD